MAVRAFGVWTLTSGLVQGAEWAVAQCLSTQEFYNSYRRANIRTIELARLDLRVTFLLFEKAVIILLPVMTPFLLVRFDTQIAHQAYS